MLCKLTLTCFSIFRLEIISHAVFDVPLAFLLINVLELSIFI